MLRFVIALPLLLISGCGQQNIKDVLGNLHTDCVRHYAGSLASGVPAQGTVTFTIDCQPDKTTPAQPLPVQP
jgi:hypothetical protein